MLHINKCAVQFSYKINSKMIFLHSHSMNHFTDQSRKKLDSLLKQKKRSHPNIFMYQITKNWKYFAILLNHGNSFSVSSINVVEYITKFDTLLKPFDWMLSSIYRGHTQNSVFDIFCDIIVIIVVVVISTSRANVWTRTQQ